VPDLSLNKIISKPKHHLLTISNVVENEKNRIAFSMERMDNFMKRKNVHP